MAKQAVPTQNNLMDVVRSATEAVFGVKHTIKDFKERSTKEKHGKNEDLEKDLEHIKTDLQTIVKFVKDFEKIQKNLDKITAGIIVILGMPGEINKKLAQQKVEEIENKNLMKAVEQLKRVLNTPAEINKKLADIDIEEIDTERLKKVASGLDAVFGKNGLFGRIEKINADVNQFKSMSTRKFIGVWFSLGALKTMLRQIVDFGRLTSRSFAELRVSLAGVTIMTEFMKRIIGLAKEVDDMSLVAYFTCGLKIAGIKHIVRRLVDLMKELEPMTPYVLLGPLYAIAVTATFCTIGGLLAIMDQLKDIKLTSLIMMPMRIRFISWSARRITKNLLPNLRPLVKFAPVLLIITATLKILGKTISLFLAILDTINAMSIMTLIKVRIKTSLMANDARVVTVLVRRLTILGRRGLRAAVAIPGLVTALVVLTLYKSIIETIKGTKRGLFFEFKVKRLISATYVIRRLINRLSRMVNKRRAMRALQNVVIAQIVIMSFAAIIGELLTVFPMMMIFVVLSPILILIVAAFAIVFRAIVYILGKLLNPKMVIIIVATTQLILLLALLGLGLLVLGLVAIGIIKMALPILMFFGVVAAVIVLMALMGYLLSFAVPYLMIAIYGVVIVAVAVLAMLAIAGMLWLLSKIELDEEKIKDNVRKIMSTALMVFTTLFETELNDPENKDSSFKKIIAVIGGAILKIIMALATAVILVATVVSVACILLIATMLRILQTIKLDDAKIKANVQKVITTANEIIDLIFGEDNEKDNKSNRGPLLGLISWAMPPLGKIIDAIFTVAYLFLMVIAIVMVLAIAGMLRWLQTIDLDPAKIMERVDTILNTADAIIDRIFAPRNDKENKSSRGVLMTIISWVDEGLAKIVEAALTVVYLALILISVLLIMGIAGLLRGLQEIDLDSEKIMERVDTVFNTADAIINRIFADRDDNGQGSNRGILVTIISWVDEGLAKIVEAALGVIYLFLVLVSVGLVLAVAGLLRGLQEIELDGDAIIEVVNTVFNTADAIINRVMQPADDSTKEGRGVFGTIISFFSEPLAKIVDALMSIAYLGLIFLAISVIHGIAAQLNSIQNIELDANTITQKIDTIFKCASVAMQKVYSASDMMPKPPKKKGLFRSIIGFFSPDLGEILDALTEIAKLATVNAAISAIAGIAKSLKTISDMQINLDAAYSRVDQIMTIAENIAERIFGRESKLKLPVPPKEKKSVFGALIDWAFGGESDDDRALKAAMKRVEGLGVINAAVGALGLIQENVKKIMDVNLGDFDAATQKVSNVMDMASTLSEKIFGAETKITLPEPTQDEVMSALIDMGARWWSSMHFEAAKADAKQQAAMKLAMRRVQALSMIASAVGSLASIVEGIDKIKNYEVPDVKTVQTKVQQIMQASNKIAFIIFNNENTGVSAGNTGGFTEAAAEIKAKVDFANAGASGVGAIAESLKSMIDKITPISSQLPGMEAMVTSVLRFANSLSFELQKLTISDNKEKFNTIIESAKQATTYCGQVQELIKSAMFTEAEIDSTHVRVQRGVAAIGEIIMQMDAINPQRNGEHVRDNCDLIDRISSTVGSFVKVTENDVTNSKNLTDNYIKFFKQVDSMDIKKLQHTDYLMRSWASISRDLKGNFEGLAQTINQHIMPMLEKVNETLDKTTKCQQEIIAELTKPVDLNGTGSTDVSGIAPSETGAGNGNTGDTNFVGETGRADGGNTINRNDDTSQAGQKRPVVNVSKPISPNELKKGKRYTVIVEKVID